MGEVKEPLVEARLPTKYGTFRIIAFPGDNSDKENLALVMGKVEGEILIRIHSECFTGDVLHSMRCDCGEQLDLAMKKIAEESFRVLKEDKYCSVVIGDTRKHRHYAVSYTHLTLPTKA